MALTIPQFANQDGRLHASDDDANVSVWPYGLGSWYKLYQSGQSVRASTTVTKAPDGAQGTVQVMVDTVYYFIPFNQAVSVPGVVYVALVNAAGDSYTVT